MKRIVISGAVLALAIGGMGVGSAAPSQFKVTGGGQIIASSEANSGGPGATLAFNARSIGAGPAAQGQLQYNDHLGLKFHGQVACLVVQWEDTDDNDETPDVRTARIAGTYTDADGAEEQFQLFIEDHDFGGPQSESEMLLFNPTAESSTCNQDVDATQELGRGNIVIHKEKAPKA